MNSIGPIIAASAAAAADQRRKEEEEGMATYSTEDLQNDWEFKIVRANRDVFHDQAALTKLVNEEKRAGWVLLEKFDDSRIRFKRQRTMQAHDEQLHSEGIDPYRTQYGMSPMKNKMIVVVTALMFSLLVMAGIMYIFSLSMRP